MQFFKIPVKFEWDKGNKGKNLKHKVTDEEAEEVFFDHNKKTFKHNLDSNKEKRFGIIGKTKKRHVLLVVFTIRSNKLRIISARDLNKKEKHLYEKET